MDAKFKQLLFILVKRGQLYFTKMLQDKAHYNVIEPNQIKSNHTDN